MTRDSLVEGFVSVTLAALTLLVYCPSFHYPFVNYDDGVYVFQNCRVQAGLSADSVRWAFTTFECGNWHPLTWLSLEVDYELYGGLRPGGFHLTNVLLHTANTLLLFGVLSRMTGLVWRSAVVAALFALHPLHVESVAWVAERKDVLSTLFWMLTLAAYLYYVRRPGVRRYLLVVLALGLGLMAKPMLVTLPCVLLLLDYWPLGRWRLLPLTPAEARGEGKAAMGMSPPAPAGAPARAWRHLLGEKLPLFALVLGSCGVTFLAQLRGDAVVPLEVFPLPVRVANALQSYVSYLGQMLWPMHLAVYYPHPGPAVSVAGALAAGVLLVGITVLVLGPGRRRPYLAVGWLWYLGTLVPVIGLVQVGGQAMADRYTYLPLIGPFLLLTWGMSDLAVAWGLPRHYLVALTAVVLSVCATLTWVQVGHWQSSLHLWEHAASVTEKNVLAHLNLGVCYNEQGRISAAREEFEKAAAIDPKLAEPHVNLGNVLADLGQWERAVAEYRQAIDLAPERAAPHFNLGNVLAALGRVEEACAAYRRAIALGPDNAGPHNNLGNLLRDLGRPEEALAEYSRAVDLDPRDASAHNNLGIVLAELGRPTEALTEFHKAIALVPDSPQPHTNLAAALQQAGRLEEALGEYREALRLGDGQAGARLRACERLRALRPRLPDLIAGRHQPTDNAERLAFAELCRQPFEHRYALAARLYADAFRVDPKLADDLRAANRLNAAGAAAAAGTGKDAAGFDEKEKARLRFEALGWLQAELAIWTKLAQSDRPQARAAVQQALRMWQRDAGLAGVRDPDALARLPNAEREAWQKLWQEVGAVLAKASAQRKKP
jgi:tetratricopeptide (TPR) repeat protein